MSRKLVLVAGVAWLLAKVLPLAAPRCLAGLVAVRLDDWVWPALAECPHFWLSSGAGWWALHWLQALVTGVWLWRRCEVLGLA